jgi:hypothetical protein
VMARMQIGRQQRDEPPHTRDGSLHAPVAAGRIHGRGTENAASTSEARAANVR